MEGASVFVKSKRFSVRIVNLGKYLRTEKNEYILSKQMVRSGTSIGANIAEAEAAFSRKDFLAKMYIAFKEASETKYWIDLLFEAEYLSRREYISIKSDCDELFSMLSAITKTTAKTLNQPEKAPAAPPLTPHS